MIFKNEIHNKVRNAIVYTIALYVLYIVHTSFVFGDNSSIEKMAVQTSPRKNNPIHMLVIFSKFKGEAPGDTLAPQWAEKLFGDRLGSISDYCKQISFGQITVTGEHLPKLYELPSDSKSYVNRIGKYVTDLLDLVINDPTVDLSLYDNDGPDGKPSSMDDDGFVDYIVLMPRSHEDNFIFRRADGTDWIAMNGVVTLYNYGFNRSTLKIDQYSGSIATGYNLNQAVGLVSHEYLHTYGTYDLYYPYYTDSETDNGGIGFWGIMSWGLLGWNGNGRPVGPCAYTRMILESIGIKNANLIDLYGVHNDIRISDVALENGKVYRIWVTDSEYILIEHRRNDGMYYERDIPQNGILISHINEQASSEIEDNKRVDIECADGKYLDAGYPWGQEPDPENGGDNLDF
jgi:M6 family metalloprotease-like protein